MSNLNKDLLQLQNEIGIILKTAQFVKETNYVKYGYDPKLFKNLFVSKFA